MIFQMRAHAVSQLISPGLVGRYFGQNAGNRISEDLNSKSSRGRTDHRPQLHIVGSSVHLPPHTFRKRLSPLSNFQSWMSETE